LCPGAVPRREAPGQASSGQACYRRSDQERAWPAPGETPDLIKQVSRLSLFQPGCCPVHALGRLPRHLRGETRLAAGCGHRVELIRDGAQLPRRLLLLGRRLIARLPLRLAEQVAGLAASLRRHLPRLAERGLRDLAARVASVLPDARRLGTGDIRRGRLGRPPPAERGIRLCVLRHNPFPCCRSIPV
jgi:hypothetical protein